MTTPSAPGSDDSGPLVDLSKNDPAADAPFDPYRYGRPEHPVPPQYAPPGYVPPPSEPQYPYGPAPYQTPGQYGNFGAYGPPPPVNPYVAPRTGNGKAIAALVIGIASIVMFWTTFFDAILVILAVVFGILGLNDARIPGRGGRGMAIAGLVCGAVGGIVALLMTIYVLTAVNRCGGISNSNSSDFKQCVQDHL